MTDTSPATAWTTTIPATEDVAATVASWSTSAAEAAAWVSSPVPVTADVVLGWWGRADVTARLLRDPLGVPVAYGEVWDDEEEDEVELARLIVDPSRRREGVGRRLVEVLLDLARQHGRSDCFLRVVPDNTAARARSTAPPGSSRSTRPRWPSGTPVSPPATCGCSTRRSSRRPPSKHAAKDNARPAPSAVRTLIPV
ncbi:MAG: GNAT family N-acetyltransferase [Solirubrobacteraceae bacterium]|nr:GNAT family N-acetyltransferase [Solirubrobacteraceae bacterium]